VFTDSHGLRCGQNIGGSGKRPRQKAVIHDPGKLEVQKKTAKDAQHESAVKSDSKD
jgi:hypothetical protein